MSQKLPPVAQRESKVSEHHGHRLIDEYQWLRDLKWPAVSDPGVLDYLKQENDYADGILKDMNPLIDKIYLELKGRVKEADRTVPLKVDQYIYWSSIEEGQQYWSHYRRLDQPNAPDQLLWDENIEAEGRDYYCLGAIKVSPDHQLMAYCEDLVGQERYVIRIKKIDDDHLLPDCIPDTMGSVVWHQQGQGFFYIPANKQWRSKSVYYHVLGSDPSTDQCIFHEKDELFSVGIDLSSSKDYLFIRTASSTTSEVWWLDMHDDHLKPTLLKERKEGHLYGICHRGDDFYVISDDQGPNFRLAKFPAKQPDRHWETIIPHTDNEYLQDFHLFQSHLVVIKSSNTTGLASIHLQDLETKAWKVIDFPDPAYSCSVQYTTFDAPAFRYVYSSLNQPYQCIAYQLTSHQKRVLKVDEIPSGFDPALYESCRVYAPTSDGQRIPISLVYKKSHFQPNGQCPLLLYGYGAYGHAIEPAFSRSIISLLDRGFVYAIGHIRGGDDLGRKWYESAKFLQKQKTFDDFITAAEYLIDQRYTQKDRLVIAGGSAGGLLMGACMNQRPDLFKAVVAHVPFVDVLNTMLDDSLPLTPGEFKEWGNPQEKAYFDCIQSYCPYQNVTQQAYPHLFVTAGLTDPRVTYWEPAKWVAKLRQLKTDDHQILLKTNMDAGHGGKTGRYHYLKEKAQEYAFILRHTVGG
ncbi:S9 family peptidase [Gammaproteobacteria bacterium]|nr:S9 family peptidase [Gammaproteobacteria bacterium]